MAMQEEENMPIQRNDVEDKFKKLRDFVAKLAKEHDPNFERLDFDDFPDTVDDAFREGQEEAVQDTAKDALDILKCIGEE